MKENRENRACENIGRKGIEKEGKMGEKGKMGIGRKRVL